MKNGSCALTRIRKETGRAPSEAIRIHAEQGCSRTLTAQALGISRQTLQRICKRFDLDKYFKPQREMRDDCHPGNTSGTGWPKGAPRFALRRPIAYNGRVWHPSEPSHLYLYAQGIR
jgi:hypothetical protein